MGQEGATGGNGQDEDQGQSGSAKILIALSVPVLVAIVGYSIAEGDFLAIASVSLIVAAGLFGLGALLGFLFGVPKVSAAAADGAPAATSRLSYVPNTNLEQVSDWLTKILIGAGLVQLGELVNSIGNFADTLAPALGNDATARAYAIVLILSAFVTGFLVGYLFTRLRLQSKFAKADRGAFEQVVERVVGIIEEQGETDAKALKLTDDQIDPEKPQPASGTLQATVAAASAPVQQQIRIQAEKAKQGQDPARSQLADPILEALEEPDGE